MHPEAYAYVEGVLSSLPPRRRVVELGGRNVNGSVRPLFDGAAYVAVDIVDGPGVDVVVDAATFVPPVPPDTVVCCEVLEHAEQPAAVFHNALRMLAPGGVAIFTAACAPRAPHSARDGATLRPGEYYGNIAPEVLQLWAAQEGAVAQINWHPRGDVYATVYRSDL